jgi:fatty acid desaturase
MTMLSGGGWLTPDMPETSRFSAQRSGAASSVRRRAKYMSRDSKSGRALWLAIIAMFAVVAALTGGAAVWTAGGGPVVAICAGGATFVSVVTLGLATHHFLTVP